MQWLILRYARHSLGSLADLSVASSDEADAIEVRVEIVYSQAASVGS